MHRDEYEPVIDAIKAPPMMTPTASESATLTEALSRIETAPTPVRLPECAERQSLRGFVLASVAAFVLIAAMLALQTFGVVDIVSAVRSVGLLTIALTLVIVIFVTSFVPIAVTARRRPLNGMTFRR